MNGIKQKLEADIKTAMLAGDKNHASILRNIKSAILDEEISQVKRDVGLSEQELINLLSKEAKKRQDAKDLYINAKEQTRANNEENERLIICSYLPVQLSDSELETLVKLVISEQEGPVGLQQMGKIISLVKERSEGKADGGRIAQLVKGIIS